MAVSAVSVFIRIPESQATSFCYFNKLAQALSERNRQLVGNFDPNAHLAQFNAAYIGPVYASVLCKILLRQADLFASTSNRSTERVARESSCLWHALFVPSRIRYFYRRSSTKSV
jgi:hypothetical protein